ncbi:prephenate dehydrogenase dimerization domain-containing protein, partial [Mesorhizobium sp. M1C.F.Ca.ET.176.01.1.1]|uniref:prephenate dehydrogenase dimerization domain-containing protein n=1 Tax=Mesorhizobium sp. M1C.F.Ca.ET.176.01.1.1 TaxID=2563922 RepID=UPI001AED7C15
FAAGGFRDFTRIAASSPEMWRDVCVANRAALLDELDIPHPPVALTLPAAASGWLMKRADGCGGTHVEPLATLATLAGSGPPAQAYFQRHSRGRPMSA